MSFRGATWGQLVLDIETSVIPDVREFLGHIKAPANYKKPESIAKYLEEAAAEEAQRAALDADLCRIVTIAWWEVGQPAPLGYIAKNEEEEAKMLTNFGKLVLIKTFRQILVLEDGFNIISIRRALIGHRLCIRLFQVHTSILPLLVLLLCWLLRGYLEEDPSKQKHLLGHHVRRAGIG